MRFQFPFAFGTYFAQKGAVACIWRTSASRTPIFVEPNAFGGVKTTIFVNPKSVDGLNSREIRLFMPSDSPEYFPKALTLQ